MPTRTTAASRAPVLPRAPSTVETLDGLRRQRTPYKGWHSNLMKAINADPALKRIGKDRKEMLIALLAMQPDMSTARAVAVAKDKRIGNE